MDLLGELHRFHQEGFLAEVEHVKAHRTKKDMQRMFVTSLKPLVFLLCVFCVPIAIPAISFVSCCLWC